MKNFLECDSDFLRREHSNFTAIAFKSRANHFAPHNTMRCRELTGRDSEQRTRGGVTSPPSFKVMYVLWLYYGSSSSVYRML